MLGFPQEGLLVDEVAADHAVLRVLPVADEGPHPVDLGRCLGGYPLAVRQGPQALQHIPFLGQSLLSSLLETASTSSGFEVLDVAEDQRHEHRGALAPPRASDVDLADAAHAVPLEPGLDRVPRHPTTRDLGEFLEEAAVLGPLLGLLDPLQELLEERHRLRMRSDRVRDVQEGQPHR